MSKILVTGGAGFIGSFIVDELIRKGHSVRILDNLDKRIHGGKKPAYLNKEAEFILGDVGNEKDMAKALEDMEIIFHEAALVGIEPSMQDVTGFIKSNTLSTAILMQLAATKNYPIKKILIPSTVAVYGAGSFRCVSCKKDHKGTRSPKDLSGNRWEVYCPVCKKETQPIPLKEESEISIDNVYSLTKFDQERLGIDLGKRIGIPTVAFRYFNVYGPRQSIINPYSGVITKFIDNISQGKQIDLFEDGLQTRDFVNVQDIVQANILAMEKSAANYGTFNVGTGKMTSVKEIGETLLKIMGSDTKTVTTHKYREGDVRHCVADISRIKKALGYSPKVSLHDGLRAVAEHNSQKKR